MDEPPQNASAYVCPLARGQTLRLYFNQPSQQAGWHPHMQLIDTYAGAIFGQPERPEVCRRLRPSPAMCGMDRDTAPDMLTTPETATHPLP